MALSAVAPSAFSHPRLNRRLGSSALLAASSPSAAASSLWACRRHRQRSQTLVGAGGPVCQFERNLNLNSPEILPTDQVAMTMYYPWMEAHNRRERMRRWLQSELCMSERQARSVLDRCPSLGDLDIRLAQRRVRQLDTQLHISRGEAALLVLRYPHQLLPPVSDLVSFAVNNQGGGMRRPGTGNGSSS